MVVDLIIVNWSIPSPTDTQGDFRPEGNLLFHVNLNTIICTVDSTSLVCGYLEIPRNKHAQTKNSLTVESVLL